LNGVGRLALICCFLLLSAACGRKGALIYPDMLMPVPPSDAAGQQSGSGVKLQFVLFLIGTNQVGFYMLYPKFHRQASGGGCTICKFN
jgi:predicted small lipoprotein YifL